MLNTSAAKAAAAIAAKADRLLTSSATHGVDDRRRRAAALQRIAALVKAGADLTSTADVPEAARRAAAVEVYSLATRRESRGRQRGFGTPVKPGWERSGDDLGLPIHRPTLQEAAELYEIACALHDEEYWRHLQGLLLERLGDYEAAARTFEQFDGPYAKYAPEHAARCRRKLAGAYDAQKELDASFDAMVEKFEERGVNADHIRYAHELITAAAANAAQAFEEPDAEESTSSSPPDSRTELTDLAATIVQTFAEHLVHHDYDAAHALLATNLAQTTPEQLRDAYERMICTDDGGDIEICVMSSDDDLPDIGANDLGAVYVAISGDGFSEAVWAIVTYENDTPKIRELEWGRP